ncbi:MAG TPA: peptidylprolyl isomerase [Lutibacter sp.]|nr:peptidylprolyl isomerase [Lutibacter sp.]
MKILKSLILLTLILTIGACKSAKYPSLKDGMYADIQTTKGDIVIQLEFENTPNTVANFVSLAEGNNTFVDEKYKGKKYYEGIKFHRVIKDFMIQGGDPDGNGRGGTGYKFGDEFPVDKEGNFLFTHDKAGTLSMANSGPNTNSSQFFITHKETPHLDGKHSVFGYVIIGQNVVDSIAQGDIINKIDIIRNGSAAKKFDAPAVFAKHMEAFEAKMKEKEQEAIKRNEKLEKAKKQMAQYIIENKAKSKKYPSGLRMMTTSKGTGVKPKDGTPVLIDYAGFFEDGRMFGTTVLSTAKKFNQYDERYDHANKYHPFTRIYSKKAQLIPGFREAMLKMTYGEKALLFIPSHLAYGEKGAGNMIPPNTDLVFEIQIVDDRQNKQ